MRKRSTRGQVSLFIIFGIVLLAIFLFIIYMTASLEIKPMKVEVRDSDALKTFIESCVDKVGAQTLFLMGRQGGYAATLPTEYHAEVYGNIGFVFHNGQKTTITPVEMKNQFDAYMNLQLPDCLSQYEEFEKQGLEVQPRNIKTDVLFAARDVVATVNYPITIKSGSQSVRLDTFVKKFPVRLKEMHTISDRLADTMVENPGYIDMTYLGELEVNSTIITDSTGEQVIVLEDPLSSLNNRPYRYLFAVG